MGIDSSEEMLAESKKYISSRLKFEDSSIENFALSDSSYDLIFSNAALQWSDDHESLFPKIISKINSNGQLAIQMPFQKENILNQILFELIKENPFQKYLNGFVRYSPLLNVDDYVRILFRNGIEDMNVFLKVYPIIAKDATDLYNFISGSSLIPYQERLTEEQMQIFKDEFVDRIKKKFSQFPSIYSFKRILLYGRKL